jgi:hypothetical protein
MIGSEAISRYTTTWLRMDADRIVAAPKNDNL